MGHLSSMIAFKNITIYSALQLDVHHILDTIKNQGLDILVIKGSQLDAFSP